MRKLTKRELQVARLTAQGFTLLNIAAQLNICERTVRFHRANIYSKIDVRNAAQLANALNRLGLLEAEDLPDRVSPANPLYNAAQLARAKAK